MAGIAFARQRAARLLELAGRRHAGLAQLCRDQESGGRCADRAGDLRQGSRRAGRRHQGARPGAALEPLRRAAIHLRQEPHRALGSLRPSRSAAEIRRRGVPDGVVVGRREGGEDRDAPVNSCIRDVTRRDALVLGAGAVTAVGAALAAQAEPERHGMSAFGDLKYPADFKHFDYVDPNAPKGGTFSHIGPTRAFNQNLPDLQFAQHLHPQGRRRAGHGAHLCEPDGARGRRAGLPCTGSPRARCDFARRAHLSLSAAAGGQVPRRQQAHRPRRRILAEDPEGQGPSDHSAIAARFRRRGGGRRRHRGRAVCAEARHATCRCSSPALPIFSRAYYSTRAVRRDHARRRRSAAAPTRSGASSPAASSNTSGSRTGGAPICRSRADRTISTSCATSSTATAMSPSRASPPRSYLFREEFTSRIWATRYDFPAVRDGRVKRDILPDDTPSGAQGWFINTRREKFKDRRRARGVDLRLRLRMDQQDHHVRGLRAHSFRVPELADDGDRQAERGRARPARAIPRPGA